MAPASPRVGVFIGSAPGTHRKTGSYLAVWGKLCRSPYFTRGGWQPHDSAGHLASGARPP